MKAITLDISEILLLEKIAKITKMDCWFGINDSGRVIDHENSGKVISTRNGVSQLIDGCIIDEEFLNHFNDSEKVTLCNLLIKLTRK